MLSQRDIISLLSELADQEQLRVTVKGSAMGGLLAGLGAFLGGITLGPPGLLLGGTAGGGAGYYLSAGQFQPAAEVIRRLPERQQRQLADKVRRMVSQLDARDVTAAVTMLAVGGGFADVRSLIISSLVRFLTSDLALEMCDG